VPSSELGDQCLRRVVVGLSAEDSQFLSLLERDGLTADPRLHVLRKAELLVPKLLNQTAGRGVSLSQLGLRQRPDIMVEDAVGRDQLVDQFEISHAAGSFSCVKPISA
jgi:hypothetical protein